MKKPEDAKFIEMVIPNNDMKAFVCETRKDLQLFLSEVKYTSCNHANRAGSIFGFLVLSVRLAGKPTLQDQMYVQVVQNRMQQCCLFLVVKPE